MRTNSEKISLGHSRNLPPLDIRTYPPWLQSTVSLFVVPLMTKAANVTKAAIAAAAVAATHGAGPIRAANWEFHNQFHTR